MNIYVASSWRNDIQPEVVRILRSLGHEVYDFKNPPKSSGFGWKSIDPNWQNWTPDEYRKALQHPLALKGYNADMDGLKAADACVLVLPSGRSASWELGWAMGQRKRGYVLQLDTVEPELMYREAELLTTFQELEDAFMKGPLSATFHIVNSDNFGRDYPNEHWIARDIHDKATADLLAEAWNSTHSRGDLAQRYAKVVKDGYELQPGFEP